MIQNLIKFERAMDLDTHGVNSNIKFSFSNYSLTYQILFINFLAAIIGLISLSIFNFYLIKNDRNILIKYENASLQIKKITSFLEKSIDSELSGNVIFISDIKFVGDKGFELSTSTMSRQ